MESERNFFIIFLNGSGFLKKDLISICVYVHVCAYVCWYPKARKGIRSSGARDTGSCELPNLDAGNQT